MFMRSFFAAAVLVLTAGAASAAGCRQGDRLGSESYSRGINAAAPSRAFLNPCSTLYGTGARSRRRIERLYPGAVVRH